MYCFFDTRKPGKYLYEELSFDFQPIYIGKGNKNRPQAHFARYKSTNTRFYSKMKAIIKDGFSPNFFILKENLSEADAFLLEVKYIKLIGRIENGGTLTNLSDGGEGQSGFKFSKESTKAMSEKRKGKKLGPMTEERKLKISISKKGVPLRTKPYHTPESKLKLSEAGKKRIGDKNPMYKRKHKESSIELQRKNANIRFGKDNPAFGRKHTDDEKIFDTWKLTDENGNEIIVENLCKFCRENNLNPSCMRELYYGTAKTHKEWRKVEKLTNNVKNKK